MRRRDFYKEMRKVVEPPPPPPPDGPVPKGHCPKCRKYIGRGIHFHIKACTK